MSIVKLQRKGQVTLPSDVRSAVGLADGDLVDVKAARGKIILTPRLAIEEGPSADDEYTPTQQHHRRQSRQGLSRCQSRPLAWALRHSRRDGRVSPRRSHESQTESEDKVHVAMKSQLTPTALRSYIGATSSAQGL